MLDFNVSKLSDDEILNKISFINKQLQCSSTMPSARFVADQLYFYLDQLYDEQDKRMTADALKNESAGIVYDSEASFVESEPKKNQNPKENKKKDFLSNGPKIIRKNNPNHPDNKQESE